MPVLENAHDWKEIIIVVTSSVAGLVLLALIGACIYRWVRVAQIVRRAEWLIPIEEIAFEYVPKAGHTIRPNRAAPSVSALSFTPSSADSGRGSGNEDGDDITPDIGDDLEVWKLSSVQRIFEAGIRNQDLYESSESTKRR